MAPDEPDDFNDDDVTEPDQWEDYRDSDGDPIGIEELKGLSLAEMPEDVALSIFDDYFPETTITRDGEFLVCEIQEHLYTKYWEHVHRPMCDDRAV